MRKAAETVRFNRIRSAETTSSVAGTFAGFLRDGRPLDSLTRDLESLEHVTLTDVNEEARSGLFEWDSLIVVIVGDREAVIPQLQESGFEAPTRVDAEGKPQ
jgi:predicted Zn-dependent peptidase